MTAARAQQRSDLMPPEVKPAPGAPQAWYPGQPLPEPPPPPPQANAPGEVKRSGGLVLPEGSRIGSLSAGSTGLPESHLVQKGDTLWDLSAHYYRNAWAWPKLWSYNPAITNPHWIYPGDVVHLWPPGGAPVPTPIAAAPAGAAPPSGVYLRDHGFVEPAELEEAGTIVGSKEEKIMLGALDEAYVKVDEHHPLAVGQRYTIYRPTREVRHPLTGERLGHVVEILGEAEVRKVSSSRIAQVLIGDAQNPIERGYFVGPLRRRFKVVAPVPGRTDLDGILVGSLRRQDLIATQDIVFVDRGRQDGVQLGNRFLVTRRGDGYQPLLAAGPVDDRRFPREEIAEILVFDLRDRIATGLVLRATREARVGDRVETRRGF